YISLDFLNSYSILPVFFDRLDLMASDIFTPFGLFVLLIGSFVPTTFILLTHQAPLGGPSPPVMPFAGILSLRWWLVTSTCTTPHPTPSGISPLINFLFHPPILTEPWTWASLSLTHRGYIPGFPSTWP